MAKKYSARERKAFHMGRAWAAGKDGKRVPCPDEKTRQSFRNGVRDTRKRELCGGETAKLNLAPLYVVNGNGEVLKVLNGGK